MTAFSREVAHWDTTGYGALLMTVSSHPGQPCCGQARRSPRLGPGSGPKCLILDGEQQSPSIEALLHGADQNRRLWFHLAASSFGKTS
jgi:hypothetical protein